MRSISIDSVFEIELSDGAFLFQKVARKLGKTVVLATTHGDLVEDFQPDAIVGKEYESDVKVLRSEVKPRLCSVCENVRVEKGSVEDYEKLKQRSTIFMHNCLSISPIQT